MTPRACRPFCRRRSWATSPWTPWSGWACRATSASCAWWCRATRFSKPHITEIANTVRDKIENSGRSVAAVSVPVNPGKHPAADIMESILLILGVLGFLSMFLSGFLVVNTISAMLAQQVRQIGMMKAVGARAGQVLGVYLGLVMVYGILSLVVAVPAAAVGAYYFTQFTAGLLNLDISSPPLPVSTLLLEIGGQRRRARWWPLSTRSSRPRERESTLRSTTMAWDSRNFGAGLVDRTITAVSGQGWLPRPLMLSLRNTFRRKGRLALTLATLALGGATFIAVFTVQSSIQLTLGDALRYWNYDTEVSFRRNYRVGEIANVALDVPGVTQIESWGFTSARRQRPGGSESDGYLMVAPPAQTDLLRPTLLEGRWLLPEDENALVINTDVRDAEPDLVHGRSGRAQDRRTREHLDRRGPGPRRAGRTHPLCQLSPTSPRLPTPWGAPAGFRWSPSCTTRHRRQKWAGPWRAPSGWPVCG